MVEVAEATEVAQYWRRCPDFPPWRWVRRWPEPVQWVTADPIGQINPSDADFNNNGKSPIAP
jgi:hypothetical protein